MVASLGLSAGLEEHHEVVANNDERTNHDEEPQPLDLLDDRNGAQETSKGPHAVRTNSASNELQGRSGQDTDCSRCIRNVICTARSRIRLVRAFLSVNVMVHYNKMLTKNNSQMLGTIFRMFESQRAPVFSEKRWGKAGVLRSKMVMLVVTK